MKRILITGGGGFVAGHLAPDLAQAGFDVIAVSRDRDLRFDDPRIATAMTPARGSWPALLADVDAVVHLAGLAHRPATVLEHDDVNHRLAAEVAEAAQRCGVQHFILVSSIAAQSGPTAAHVLTEASVPAPGGAYGEAKLAAEQAVARSGVSFTILRPVVIDGPGAKGNASTLNALARLPLPLPFGALSNRRSTLSVANFNSAIRTVLFNPKAMGETFIVADSDALSVADIIARARLRAGKAPNLFNVSPHLLKFALKIIGRGTLWARLGCPLVVSPAKLISIGWMPSAD